MRRTDSRGLLTLIIVISVIAVMMVGGDLLIGSERTVTPARPGMTMPGPAQHTG